MLKSQLEMISVQWYHVFTACCRAAACEYQPHASDSVTTAFIFGIKTRDLISIRFSSRLMSGVVLMWQNNPILKLWLIQQHEQDKNHCIILSDKIKAPPRWYLNSSVFGRWMSTIISRYLYEGIIKQSQEKSFSIVRFGKKTLEMFK